MCHCNKLSLNQCCKFNNQINRFVCFRRILKCHCIWKIIFIAMKKNWRINKRQYFVTIVYLKKLRSLCSSLIIKKLYTNTLSDANPINSFHVNTNLIFRWKFYHYFELCILICETISLQCFLVTFQVHCLLFFESIHELNGYYSPIC